MEWVYIAGLGISIATLIFGALGLRGKVRRDYTELLQAEVDGLRKRLTACEGDRDRLRGDLDWWQERFRQRERGE